MKSSLTTDLKKHPEDINTTMSCLKDRLKDSLRAMGWALLWATTANSGLATSWAAERTIPITRLATSTVTGNSPNSVQLVMVGDIMLDDGPGRTIAAGGDPLAPFEAILRAADYTIGNLECPIATTGAPLDNKIYTFRAHPRVLPLLQGRFDALSVANNHSGDYGPAAFVETLDLLRRHMIMPFGGGRDLREAHAPLWIERKGLRIAVLGYNEFKPRSFEAGAHWAGVAWSDDAEVISDIEAARKAGADVVLGFMHWGWEREYEPSTRQRQLAHRMIDAGIDAVIGSHPHVTQGSEIYRGRPIIWSLGNFVFDGFDLPAARTGWVLRMTLDRQGVRAWDTITTRIDEVGTPWPVSGAASPCGQRGQNQVKQCRWTGEPGAPVQPTRPAPGRPATSVVRSDAAPDLGDR